MGKNCPALLDAELAGNDEIERCLEGVTTFLEKRRPGIPKFAESILSLSGKWKLIHSKLPTAPENEDILYLREQFEAHVFKPEELQAELKSVIAKYVTSLQEVENQLLVQCRADISESDLEALQAIPAASSQEVFSHDFGELLHSMTSILDQDLGVETAKLIASLAGAEIAAEVAIRVIAAVAVKLGIDAGILGTGAATSAATFGVSLVAAIVVDIAVDGC